MISVSLVILTMNRKATVDRSLKANIKNAGYPIREIIHVDNGSEDGFVEWFKREFNPSVQISHRDNLGVAKGYNRGLLMATSSHIAITGCDRLMPPMWLLSWVDALERVPNTGVISLYSDAINHSDRFKEDSKLINGVKIRIAPACEARIHSRRLLLEVGFMREDFGLYGYEDCEWLDRVERYTRELGLINYILPDLGIAKHLEEENNGQYKEMKVKQGEDPRKPRLVQLCHSFGSPYYNPYSRFEPDLLGK